MRHPSTPDSMPNVPRVGMTCVPPCRELNSAFKVAETPNNSSNPKHMDVRYLPFHFDRKEIANMHVPSAHERNKITICVHTLHQPNKHERIKVERDKPHHTHVTETDDPQKCKPSL